MRLQRYDDPEAYYQRVEPFLVAHEAAHCLPLGICNTLRRQPMGAAPPYLALIERDDGSVAAVILRTPPHNVVFSLMDGLDEGERDAALALAADDLGATYRDLSGAFGPTAIVAAFAARWRERGGHPLQLARRERVFQIERVVPVRGVPGHCRPVAEADRLVVVEWLDAFQREAMPGVNEYNAAEFADRMIAGAGRDASVWVDGTPASPVSLAAYGNPTPHGIRIGPVYTPPDQRGKGYASACVAALSQMLLDGGRQFVFLFTDLANPTSNHIYQTIGYAPVCDMDEYRADVFV